MINWKAGLAICLALVSCHSGNAASQVRPPNFIVILADDLGYNDLGCYGSPRIKTPNLDRMAAEGLRFTSFYAAAPVCTPSRAGLLTGCYPVRLGLGDELCNQQLYGGKVSRSFVKVIHASSTVGLNPDETIIPEALKAAGYTSGMIGKWHLGDAPEFLPLRQGFDWYFGTPYSNDMKPFYFIRQNERLPDAPRENELTTTFTHYAKEFIRDHRDKPFFLYLAHNMPHTPLTPGEKFAGKSPRGLYGDAVEELDWSVGEVLTSLKDNGLDSNTLVIFTSDNGPWLVKGEDGGSAFPLRNGKTSSYEGGFRVPCVMWGPGVISKPGRVIDAVASTMDFLPTFTALAGLDYQPSKPIDGHDITSIIKADGKQESPYDHFYFYFGSELHGVRQGRWKYRAINTLFNEDIYRRDEFANAPMPAALYDMEDDRAEQKSVLKDRPRIAKRMEALMDDARKEFGDTLTSRTGTVIRPAGKSDHPVAP